MLTSISNREELTITTGTMKLFNAIRRNRKSSQADDLSVDDSSLYTTGMRSRGGHTINTVNTVNTHNTRMTHQTTISEQIRRVRGVTKPNGGCSIGDDSTISGLQSLDSHYKAFAMPRQPPPRFEGGPLSRSRIPPTPPLTPIESTPTSSARSMPLSANASSKSIGSTSLEPHEHATPRRAAGAREGPQFKNDSSRPHPPLETPHTPPQTPPALTEVSLDTLDSPSSSRVCALSPYTNDHSRETEAHSQTVSIRHRPFVEDGADFHDSDSDWTPQVRNSKGPFHTPKLLFHDDQSTDKDEEDDEDNEDDYKTYEDDYKTYGDDYKTYQDDDTTYKDDYKSYDDDESTLDMTLGSKINMSDAELMDERNASPGALRLTEEGLVEHTEKRHHETGHVSHSVFVGFDVWKKQQAERKFYRDKFQERDDQLEERIAWARAHSESERKVLPARTEPLSSALDKIVAKRRIPAMETVKRLTLPQVKEEGVDDLSLTPMDTMGMDVLEYSPSQPARPHPFGLRRKKKLTTEELIEQERARQREAQAKHVEDENQEFERIQQQRQAYLEKQREIEAQARIERHLNPVIEDTVMEDALSTPVVEESLPLMNDVNSVSNGKETVSVYSHSETTFTLNTEASSEPCALCGEGERTHIATPCMHYCFCEDCVVTLQERRVNVCPVCSARRVSFTKVFF